MDARIARGLTMPREVLDAELSPSRSAKDAAASLGLMVTRTTQALSDPALTVTRDIAYGARPRQKLDVFRPAGPGLLPAVIFLHGGFWQEGDKSVSGFAASTFAALGWAWISVGYTLTPEVSLTQLTGEIAQALTLIHETAAEIGLDPRRLVLAGHSAGGHLAACICADIPKAGLAEKIAGAVLVSGVFDLAPIARSYVNDMARITAEETEKLSPLRHKPARTLPVHMVIGADEPQAFHDQSQALRDGWRGDLPGLTYDVAAGRDHFDVLEELNATGSPTVRAILGMGRARG